MNDYDYEYRKDNEKCVCVNIYVKCDKKDACGKDMWERKDYNKDDCCADVNVFGECKKDEWKKNECRKDDWKKKDCCVEVNIFADCNKKR